MPVAALSLPRAEGANHFRMERQKGILSAGNGENVHVSLGERKVVERGIDYRRSPAAPTGFIDREEATGIVIGSLQIGLASVEVTGEHGIGKSWMLCRAGAEAQSLFADGVIRVAPGTFGGSDLLQALFEAFYGVEERCRPARRELRERFVATRALLLVDDAALDDTALEQLRDVAPGCAVLLATHQPRLQRDAGPIVLGGLSAADSMTLLERLRGAPIAGADLAGALNQCQTMGGHPERLSRSSRADPASLQGLDASSRGVLDMLAAFHPQPVQAAVITDLSGRRDALTAVEALIGAGWVYQDDGEVRLMPQVVAALQAPPVLASQRRIDGLVRLAHRAGRHPRAMDSGLVSLPLLWSALDAARKAHAWLDVMAIVRAWDVPLVLACRWDAAKRALDWHAKAAWKLGDERERAWALHQRGTLELAQGYPPLAAQLLRESFDLAEQVEDHALAASARYHLGWLTPEAPPEGWASTSGPVPLAASDPFERTVGPPSPMPASWHMAPHASARSLAAQVALACAIGLAGALTVAAVLRMADAPVSSTAVGEETATGLTRTSVDVANPGR
ncbi:ATP-binding protein [Variovorax rhizosphaerae]|uniref:ATP-binding protein n=1 Tax=Variovorax rhizosphaerae TaxID=1836200 RepID=A0ABU8WDE5_9BURK